MTSDLYRRHIIWRRIRSDQAVRYVCFEALHDGRFSVQSCDWYSLPIKRETIRQHDDQAVELFIETDPVERNGSFASLAEAIQSFDVNFENHADFA
jgi:hypothetical protein